VKNCVIGVLLLSTTLCIHLILPILSLLDNPLIVPYLLFRCPGSVVLKYDSIMLFVFGITSFSMNYVSSVKFLCILLALVATLSGIKSWLFVNRDKRPWANDMFSALNILEILSIKLFNSLICSLLCFMVFFIFRISFSNFFFIASCNFFCLLSVI